MCVRRVAKRKEEEAAEAKAGEKDRGDKKAAAKLRLQLAWVRSWSARCESDYSVKVCSEAPASTPKSPVKNCRDNARCTEQTGDVFTKPLINGKWTCDEECASVSDCESGCQTLISQKISRDFDAALASCLNAYVEAEGKGKFGCSVSLPSTASVDVSSRLDKCTAECSAKGPETLALARETKRAEKEGPGLVLNYKSCMVAADSTALARKYQAYDQALYLDLIGKADAKCRTANRCAWVEKYSSNTCLYTP
jgi:hypothetical protein